MLFVMPFTCGFVYPYDLGESIPRVRVSGCCFHFTAFSIEISVSKQCIPLSDIAMGGI